MIQPKASIRPLISSKIKLLACIVLVLGALLKIDLWTRPDSKNIKLKINFDRFNKNSDFDLTNRTNRRPSSESQESKSQDLGIEQSDFTKGPKFLTLNWNCSQSSATFQYFDLTHVRLTGGCLSKVKSLKNIKNGYTANLFEVEKVFTTDFMSLDKGENNLEIEWIEENNRHPSILKFIIE